MMVRALTILFTCIVSAFVLFGVALLLVIALGADKAMADCGHPYPIGPNSPTGVAGCTVYGDGIASWWGGNSAARNDCQWPWRNCQTISIQSLDTGLVIVVTPHMWGDLYTGTPNQRLVDLTRGQVLALGLDPSAGLFRVRVEPADADTGQPLPDTAMSKGD